MIPATVTPGNHSFVNYLQGASPVGYQGVGTKPHQPYNISEEEKETPKVLPEESYGGVTPSEPPVVMPNKFLETDSDIENQFMYIKAVHEPLRTDPELEGEYDLPKSMNPIKRFQEEDKIKNTVPKVYPKPSTEEKRPFHFTLELEQLESMLMEDRKHLITAPIPKYAGTVKFYLLKNRDGLLGGIYPKFELYLEGTRRLLLSAKKRSGNWTGNYMITLDHESMDTSSPGYMGKLRADFWKNSYNIYDDGENPARAKKGKYRENIGAVLYEGPWFASKGPRKMTVVVPKADGDKMTSYVPLTVLHFMDFDIITTFALGQRRIDRIAQRRERRFNNRAEE